MSRALVLIGMSGVGKTTYASQYAEQTKALYLSADDEIANRIVEQIRKAGIALGQEKIDLLAAFVGKFGAPQYGGLDKQTFTQRQKIYRDAELEDLKALPRLLDSAYRQENPFPQPIIYDSTGSFCEVIDCDRLEQDSVYSAIERRASIVHLTCSPEQEQAILARQLERPKPMLYRPAFFDRCLQDYLDTTHCREDEIVPDDFLRFVFPTLIAERRLRYQKLAHVSLCSSELEDLGKKRHDFSKAFLELVLHKRTENNP